MNKTRETHYREALAHIVEYWNCDRNEGAMYDALEHMIETAAQALESEVKTAAWDPVAWAVEWAAGANETWHSVFINERDALQSASNHADAKVTPLYTARPSASDPDPRGRNDTQGRILVEKMAAKLDSVEKNVRDIVNDDNSISVIQMGWGHWAMLRAAVMEVIEWKCDSDLVVAHACDPETDDKCSLCPFSTIYDPAYVREKFADYQSQIDGLKEELEFVRKAAGTQKLDKPAMVGGVRFGVGVKWSTVVDAAQRFYEYGVTPENEANRIARAQETVAYIRTGKTRPGGGLPAIDEDGLIGSAIDGDALIEAVFNRTIPFTYKSFGRALLAEWTTTPKVLTVAAGENASLTEEDRRDLEEARKSLQCFSMSTEPVDRILARRSSSKDPK